MQLKSLYKHKRQVAALMEDGRCPLVDALRNTESSMRSSAKGMAVLFERYAEKGRIGMTSDLFHEVDKNNNIWEFIKGRIRVLCFLDPDNGELLILSHQFTKKSNKTPVSEVKRAIRLKDQVMEARRNHTLTIVETEGESQ